jgi:hypothetical protein
MSQINMGPQFCPFGSFALRVALVGEDVDFLTADQLTAFTYTLASTPVGSSAVLTGSVLAGIDVAGKYVVVVAAPGGARVTAILWVFAVAVFDALANKSQAETRGEGAQRGILLGLARARTDAELDAINAGTWPPGLNLAVYGG